MTHKTHSSWKRFKPKRGVPANLQAEAQQRLAEGLHRPEPGLEPPMTHDEHFDAKVKAIKERQEALENGDTPEEPTP